MKNTPTLGDAVAVARILEPLFAKAGLHCAVGGSCMYRGHSDKDIDLLVYAHDAKPVDPARVRAATSAIGVDFTPVAHPQYFNRHVLMGTWDGHRVDLLLT